MSVGPAYAELQTATNFSFLRGASHPSELVERAKALGLAALAVTDRNSLAGIVRAHVAAKANDVRFIVGCRLDLNDGLSLLCYPTDRAAYGRLCRLLTTGQRRAEKGGCDLSLNDVAQSAEGQIFILLPPEVPEREFPSALARVRARLSAPLYLAAHCLYQGDDRARLARLAAIARTAETPLVAVNDVHMHDAARRPLQDLLTCVREKCTLEDAGLRLAANAERHLKGPEEMARLFAGHESALARTAEIAAACRFSLDELRYEYPDEPVPRDKTPQQHLRDLTEAGARWRYPQGLSRGVRALIEKELALIEELGFAPYFLTVHDIVQFARSQDPPILCQGRGSAANSVVCFCLGVTSVDPTLVDLLFERFVTKERGEPPDIDIDFEHERREEVIQYIYERYGRERAGLAATVITYRGRSAVRDAGKAMGLSEDAIGALAGMVWGSWGEAPEDDRVREAGLDPADPLLRRTLDLAAEMVGFPRHLSQHVGGFVLTRSALCETVPIGNAAMEDRTVIEWDKDDIDALGILKVDVLSLGMLTCIRKSFDLVRDHYGRALTLASVPQEDPSVYAMLSRGDSVGVFQVESRAQMNMLPRLKPKKFYDLVIEVAIVRPGPIQGDMVHPYLRRRDGLEDEVYPAPAPQHGPPDELEQVLKKTLGVPIFQEQAMKVAMVAAKFTPGELNELRHAMATFRRRGTIEKLEDKMIRRMVARGYDPDYAQRCFNQIKGFGEYGFPESHSASFSLLVYASSWLKCHYPAVFTCALLNSQPMGFYAPAQLVRDAREHGVEVRPPDINESFWDSTLEPSEKQTGVFALRLGLRQVDGLGEAHAARILAARHEPYTDVWDVWGRSGAPAHALEKIAAADGFRSTGLDRRAALWEVRAITAPKPLPLFAHAEARETGAEPRAALPAMALSEHVIADYQTLRLSLKAHPMSFLRAHMAAAGSISAADLTRLRDGARVSIAGVILIRQRPGTAKGVVFITLEDETGVANAVVWPKTLEAYRKTVMGARLMLIHGRVQRHGDIIHVIAQRLEDRSGDLALLSETGPQTRAPLARADEVLRPVPPGRGARHPRDVRIIPKSRDFH